MFKSSLIPSESHSFPDHFRAVVVNYRNSVQKEHVPVLQGPEAAPKQGFSRLVRSLLRRRIQSPSEAENNGEKSHLQNTGSSDTPGEAAADTSTAPARPSPEAATSLPPTSAAAPAGMPFRKSVVPAGLKRKARWKSRVAGAEPPAPESHQVSASQNGKVSEHKPTLKTLKRSKPIPHFVQSPPPNLVQALLSYAAVTSGQPTGRDAPAPEKDESA